MKKRLFIAVNIFATIILLIVCMDLRINSCEELKDYKNRIIKSSVVENDNVYNKVKIEPKTPQYSLEKGTGADMAELDYASDNIVIFHMYFGLFVYDLKNSKIINSLDLKAIDCNYTQGDSCCEVSVSEDGNTVQLHAMDNKRMYVYSVLDSNLYETSYAPMKNAFGSQFEDIEKVAEDHEVSYSYNAVKFENGEYGYLVCKDGTLGTLKYVRGEREEKLF